MIYIFTALYCEAKNLIRQLHLTKNSENTHFQEFYNEKSGIRLTVTGVGGIAAATAVGSICASYPPAEGDLLLNIGTCAYIRSANSRQSRPQTGSFRDVKGIFLCNQITEQATGRSFYPDMLYRHEFREASIVTGTKPWNAKDGSAVGRDAGCDRSENDPVERDRAGHDEAERDRARYGGAGHDEAGNDGAGCDEAGHDGAGYDEVRHDGAERDEYKYGDTKLFDMKYGSLYDMEAAAVYQAGAYFFAPHQMLFLKIVSDFGAAEKVSPGQVERLMEMYGDGMLSFIGRLQALSEQAGARDAHLTCEGEEVEALCRDLHCSRAMCDSLKQQFHYLALTGADIRLLIQNIYKEGLVPCRDRREGKLRLEELKRTLF